MSTLYFEAVRREHYIVSYWRQNDVSGSTQAIDYSSHNSLVGAYDGSPAMGPALIQGDSSSASRVFGTGKDMQVEDIAQLRLTTAFSLEAWVAPATASMSANLLSKLNSGGTQPGPYALSLASGTPRLAVGNGTTSTGVSGTSALPVGIPSHVIGTLFRGTLSIFVNGALSASAPIGAQVVADSAQPFFVAGGASPFSGVIAEVAVYNGALSSLRAMRHFALGQQIITDPAHFISVDPPVYA